MNPVTAISLAIMIWWTVLFIVLPFGTRPVAEADEQSGWRGVPQRPMIWRKIAITTGISIVIFIGCYLVITSPILSFRSGWLAMPN